LARDPDPATTKALADAAGDKSWIVQAAALEALGKRGDRSALNTVEKYMSDEKMKRTQFDTPRQSRCSDLLRSRRLTNPTSSVGRTHAMRSLRVHGEPLAILPELR
jgi:HEAT repeats